VEISRVPENGPAFYVGLQIGNAELGVVADGEAGVTAPQRILLNVNVADAAVGAALAASTSYEGTADHPTKAVPLPPRDIRHADIRICRTWAGADDFVTLRA
jgi:hypothetical protein